MAKRRRIDSTEAATQEARLPSKARIEQPALAPAGQTRRLADRDEWLVTDGDGAVRVMTGDVFRDETLHQQLLQMVVRSHWVSGKRR